MGAVRELAVRTNRAYRQFLKTGTTRLKNAVLLDLAVLLESNRTALQKENARDLEQGRGSGLSKAVLDRLALSDRVLEGMAQSCREVAALPDPVGRIADAVVRPQGFRVGRMRVPIGVIGIVYEARPNVTVEAAALCLKSGNGVILRGGSDAFHSNTALVGVVRRALKAQGVDDNLVSCIETTDRAAVDELVSLDEWVHLIIPRGGEGLIRSVVGKSKIPVLKHYKGVCHVYVDAGADLAMAEKLAVNAKVQRPAVCNAMETLLVDEAVASEFIPRAVKTLRGLGVEIRGCGRTRALCPEGVQAAAEDDWFAEYLDLILAVKVVRGVGEAIDHINTYGSAHTDAIVTRDLPTAERFVREVDSASVMVNASTRLADGGIYGLGAEIGISTDRLHARGPMGLEELTCAKWVVFGDGHVRE
jgi:glutamate-5-semialdehyde dehydrogenase